MTERKPTGVDQGSWVDQQISAAIARGEFDDIPGKGKPIEDLDKPYDEAWFVRKLRDEGFDTEAMMPASLRLRKRLERLPDEVAGLRTEDEVRGHVGELNEQIEAYLRMPSGPPVSIHLVDVDRTVAEWRERTAAADSAPASRPDSPPSAAAGSAGAAESTEGGRRPWWRRLARSRR